LEYSLQQNDIDLKVCEFEKIILFLYQNWYTYKNDMEGILEITSRQFREQQKSVFEIADKGKKVIITRRKKQSYVLTPIDDDDLYFTPEMLAKIDYSIQQAKDGKKVRLTPELRKELFDDL
jgi:hypothetical protein